MATTYNKKRWFMLGISIIICIFSGIGYAWSVFQKPLVAKFGWTNSDVALAYSIQIGIGVLVPFFGKLQDLLKTRWIILAGALCYGSGLILTGFSESLFSLYIGFGLLGGIGIAIIYTTCMSFMVKIFADKRGMISGILAASFGMGAVIWAPIGANLIISNGIGSAFKILGVLLGGVVLLASLFLQNPPKDYSVSGTISAVDKKSNAPKVIDLKWQQMLVSPLFYIVLPLFIAGAISGLMLMGFASPIAQNSLGMTAQRASFIVSIIAICNTLGRLSWGTLSDRFGRKPVLIVLFSISITSFLMLSFLELNQIILFSLFLVGFCYGGYVALMAPLTADLFGTKYLNVNYGFVYIAYPFAGLIGPRLAGYASDKNNGDFTFAFFMAGTIAVLGLILAIILTIIQRRKTEKIRR